MGEPVISVQGLSKRYQLGTMAGHNTLRDQLSFGAQALFRAAKGGGAPKVNGADEFWALNDVSFEVRQGEVLGIVGRNGAGKSTMLKVLSQITEPTSGEIKIRGRVASLLEVGTGFHPELTGRENVYLNGAVLGMTRREIRARFDQIVAFADVEKFLDTPVKRYSSGMYVRLAFAVAAHLDPEILIVDEVLAVGDVQFQKKCMGKMEDVGKQGRTVLLVSHNMSFIESLCSRAILLEQGRLKMDDSVRNVVRRCIDDWHAAPGTGHLANRADRKGTGAVRAISLRVLDELGNEEPSMKSGGNHILEVGYENNTNRTLENVVASLDFYDDRHYRVLQLRSKFVAQNVTLKPGRGTFRCIMNDVPLANGSYGIHIYIANGAETEMFDYVQDAAFVNVTAGDFFGTGHPGIPNDCKILYRVNWEWD